MEDIALANFSGVDINMTVGKSCYCDRPALPLPHLCWRRRRRTISDQYTFPHLADYALRLHAAFPRQAVFFSKQRQKNCLIH